MRSTPQDEFTHADVAIVGGGVTGVSASVWLRESAPHLSSVIVESSERMGGKLQTRTHVGHPSEAGAETLLLRRERHARSDLSELLDILHLTTELQTPHNARPYVFAEGARYPVMPRSVLGIPGDLRAAQDAGVLSPATCEAFASMKRHTVPQDLSVAELLYAFLPSDAAREILSRSVEPLLGGVYAASAETISAQMAIPSVLERVQHGEALLQATAGVVGPRRSTHTASPFATLERGVSSLIETALMHTEATKRRSARVSAVREVDAGWELSLNTPRGEETLRVSAVLLALPAPELAELLTPLDVSLPHTPYTSVATVMLRFPDLTLPERSGVLVSPSENLTAKAFTFTSQKWENRGSGMVRASVGRSGDAALELSDDELVARVCADLATVTGADVNQPEWASVTRWPQALPNYAPTHAEQTSAARAQLPRRTLAIAGAACDGVGISACVTSARRAVERISSALR